MYLVQLSPPQTWQNMPSLGTERLNPKGVKPFLCLNITKYKSI